MNFKHGSLESIILNAMWELEKSGIYKNSVKDVYEFLSRTDSTKRAYTTIKTVMKTTNQTKMEARIRPKLRALIGNVTHRQNVADQTLDLIKSTLTEEEQNDSDTCRVVENLSCVCEEALQVLCEELKKDVTIVMVTHNMQQAARISDKTAFFLLGEMIEMGDTEQVFSEPRHPETERYITGRFG